MLFEKSLALPQIAAEVAQQRRQTLIPATKVGIPEPPKARRSPAASLTMPTQRDTTARLSTTWLAEVVT